MNLRRRILCTLFGRHRYRGWVTHLDPERPCVFTSEVHLLRQCERCPKQQHAMAPLPINPETVADERDSLDS
jgi:hypothetical protein